MSAVWASADDSAIRCRRGPGVCQRASCVTEEAPANTDGGNRFWGTFQTSLVATGFSSERSSSGASPRFVREGTCRLGMTTM